MSKVHKSLRIDSELATDVLALALDGESETATYTRVLQAGVNCLRKSSRDETDSTELIASLKSHIATLQATNKQLGDQLTIKDGQIHALSVLTAQAQELHGMATKAIEQPEDANESTGKEKRRGFWSRFLRG